jgi:hypothetical protein
VVLYSNVTLSLIIDPIAGVAVKMALVSLDLAAGSSCDNALIDLTSFVAYLNTSNNLPKYYKTLLIKKADRKAG